MRWIIIAVGAAFALAAGLIGFVIYGEATEPDRGTITGKDHEPAWVQYVCTYNGRSTTCSPIFHPECWRIDYAAGGERGDACVSAAEWQEYEVGDLYEGDRG